MAEQQFVVRDPIHGLIELSKKEVMLMNTTAFQRLRRIRQLAMAFLVYPGTLHTCFEHPLGVMHIAGRICRRLKQLQAERATDEEGITDRDCEQVRFAALLHDIGHGPFSHVSEYLLDQCTLDQASVGTTREKIHEKVTVDIITNDPEIGEILTPEECEFAAEMIRGKAVRDFRRDIVSSDLDADKMDYLLRDSYFAGVRYGAYDLDKIIESCRVYREGEASYLAISDEGIYALEQLLLAKHHMTQQVYRHRVRSITDAMIVRGINLAIREGNEAMTQLYQYDGTEAFMRNYLEYHDERLMDVLKRCAQEDAREMFDRLYRRKLFKMIGELPLKDVTSATAKRRLLQMDDGQKQRWERVIAEHLGIDPDSVIVNKLQIRNPKYGSRSYSLDPEAIMVFEEKDQDLRRLSDYATELIFTRPPSDEAAMETVQVYAPRDHWNTMLPQERKAEQSRLEAEVRRILLSL